MSAARGVTIAVALAGLGAPALAGRAGLAGRTAAQAVRGPDMVVVGSGELRLKGLFWRPAGPGPFPAVLFNHGSGLSVDDITDGAGADGLGRLFARHGFAFLFLFRRGAGLSRDQGGRGGDALDRAMKEQGPERRNRIQLEMLDQEQVPDAEAGLTYLRARTDVDSRRLAIVGHSFGGSVTLLQIARDSAVRAAVDFSGAAGSWSRSPELRRRLLAAVGATTVPVFFIHDRNDYSTEPGPALSAEMTRLGKANQLRIYPAYGRTPRDGHNLVFLDPGAWEQDVFAFLERYVGR